MELTKISEDFKIVHSYEKRDIVFVFLQALIPAAFVYGRTTDISLAIPVFLITLISMWYVRIGGLVRGMVIQFTHSKSSYPISHLDFTGSFGNSFFSAWHMIEREQELSKHNESEGRKMWDKIYKEREKDGKQVS